MKYHETENPSEKSGGFLKSQDHLIIRKCSAGMIFVVLLIKPDIQVFRQAFLRIIKNGISEIRSEADLERRIHG